MIQALLLVLKIIGITLLSVLGLLLLVLLLVLFVPVCYRVRVIHTLENTQGKVKVSFLFPLLLVTVEYLKKLSYKVRVFGIAVVNSDKPKKEKQKKAKKVKKKKDKKREPVTELLVESVQVTQPENAETVSEKAEELKDEKASGPRQKETVNTQEKQRFFEKIKSKISKIRETISNIIKKIKRLLHQKEEVQRILSKPETKKALSFIWDKLKGLLKHILPRKVKGYVAFGADDPATTGQVLGVLSVVYARTGQLLEIRPNFQEKQLECDVELKGRVQVFTLLVIAVKVFLNQELRQLITEFKGLKDIE